MGRRAREESKSKIYHVITRGNNRGCLFHGEPDFQKYQQILSESLQRYPVKLHHYCLMSNHVHLLVWAETLTALSRFMHGVQRAYHHYYRKSYTWYGHLFQGRYRSLKIEKENHLLDCGRYIERNPLRAKMVKTIKAWPYSSYGAYAYGDVNDLVHFSSVYLGLAKEAESRREIYRGYVELTRPYEEILDRELLGV